MKTLFKSTLMLLLMLPMSFFAQETVSGVVSESATGLPIPGANVIVKGTTNGAVTDFDGNYTIQNVSEDDILVFSFLGFASEEIPYEGQETLDVQLDEDQATLEEVVLIGYGSTSEQDATGSVEKISSESFNQGAVVSPEQLISGKSAGVRITPGSGEPGGGSEIRIRGGSSLSGNNSPLIVVDGVPLDQRGVQGVRNQLNSINPNEIEDFVILKDAAATSIYGSRASNGVILITTKSGKKDSPLALSYDLKVSAGRIIDKVDVLDADQFRNLINDTPGTDPSLLGDANTDWQDQIYQTAVGAIHNFTATQGFENFSYRVNYNHTSQTGVLKTDVYERNALNIALNQDLFDNHLKLSLTSKGIVDENRFADQGAIGAAVGFDPTQPVYEEGSYFGGYYEHTLSPGQQQIQATRNPLALLEQLDGRGVTKRNITNLNAEYKFHFLPELKFNVNAGFDYSENDGYNRRPLTSAANNQDIPYFEDYGGFNRNTLLDFYFNYKNDIDFLDTEIDLTAGHSYQEFFITSKTTETVSNNILESPRDTDRNALESYFGRASFDIANKYLISGSVRRDGSSRFGGDNKWSIFPALSVGWKLHNENFLADSNVLNQLKLRAGYGVTGNQEIGPNYGYFGTYNPSVGGARYQFGNQFYNTLRPEAYDSDLKWEELQTYNVGIDYGLFNNRISGTVEAYYRETEDLLATVPVPAGANLTDLLVTNVGSTVSKGLEFGINGAIIQQEDFNWDINYNLTFQDLEITNLTLGDNPNFQIPQGEISGGVGNNIQLWKEGYDPTTFNVFRQVYNEDGQPIEGAYVDVNGDNEITEEDRVAYKKATPDYFMGLTNTMRYKNLDFSFTFRGNFGNYMYNNTQSSNGFVGAGTVTPQPYYSNFNSNVLESNFNNNQFFSDYYIQKADFVKLDNISVGYSFPGEELDIRTSLTATNVWTITDYEGLDPEIANGIDNNFYPRSTTIVLGLNLSF
ncbi:SusC/RagA family TonB-linked outer membrane protein [Salegentibacter salinarum]|uniref:SusC/RagA family TonB-linked outer membrane protein n=1 Tax=Salegentibacter salinarum TaxID=447422 RepID=A0A2N0TPJ2_9FLAO|nr:SusC/RagA family TonB-linked outer membrane protein [Salegentibacter salinarum]PKD16652.1 SusC/RagA family TonB-linked outer membrane protein [Salegentibacter salinarum]SKB61384.1 iron complex outermembrane recepter protein [Salegentibacter salinarum]